MPQHYRKKRTVKSQVMSAQGGGSPAKKKKKTFGERLKKLVSSKSSMATALSPVAGGYAELLKKAASGEIRATPAVEKNIRKVTKAVSSLRKLRPKASSSRRRQIESQVASASEGRKPSRTSQASGFLGWSGLTVKPDRSKRPKPVTRKKKGAYWGSYDPKKEGRTVNISPSKTLEKALPKPTPSKKRKPARTRISIVGKKKGAKAKPSTRAEAEKQTVRTPSQRSQIRELQRQKRAGINRKKLER